MLLAVYYPLALVGVGTWLLMFAWKNIKPLSNCDALPTTTSQHGFTGDDDRTANVGSNCNSGRSESSLLYCHRDNLRRLREGSEGVWSPSSPTSS